MFALTADNGIDGGVVGESTGQAEKTERLIFRGRPTNSVLTGRGREGREWIKRATEQERTRLNAHRSMSGRSTIANWKNTPIRLQFFSMVPHNGAEKFKTIPRNYDRAGGEIGESWYRDCDGLLKAFKSAIKKTIFRTFLRVIRKEIRTVSAARYIFYQYMLYEYYPIYLPSIFPDLSSEIYVGDNSHAISFKKMICRIDREFY